MRFGMLGTGAVGQALGGKLVALGHEVTTGARRAGNERAVSWADSAGDAAHAGSFADAAAFGEAVVNATAGGASLEALAAAGRERLRGKVLIDVANPLSFSEGGPPTLSVCNTDSLGERIQREFPEARVVKTLNTVNARVMVEPELVPGPHTLFLCGDEAAAKGEVAELLGAFGWPAEEIVDLGDLSAARGMEMYLPLWLRLSAAKGTPQLNVRLVTA